MTNATNTPNYNYNYNSYPEFPEYQENVMSFAAPGSEDPTTGLIVGADGHLRPPWAAQSPDLQKYYDTEWGVPVHGEAAMFERLCLEGFQAGLSWRLILKRRPLLREAFAGFDPDVIAEWDETEVERLLAAPGMIRNRRKIAAVLSNARATVALRHDAQDRGPLDKLIWSYQPDFAPEINHVADIPSTSPEAAALSKELKALGFKFVGPTTMFALFEATGIVDTHVPGAFRAPHFARPE